MRLSATPSLRMGPVRDAVMALAAVGLGLAALFAPLPAVAAEGDLARRAQEIEAYAPGQPKRALIELATLLSRADAREPADRRLLVALQGQALVFAGRTAEAQILADRLESESRTSSDPYALATALLVRGAVQSFVGDAATASAFARQANVLLQGSSDTFLTHWALMSIGTTARARGNWDDAMASLHDALALAERLDNPYRRSSALYQLSWLHLALKQPDRALEAALEAYKYAEAAGSAYAMANARMAESAALEPLGRADRELAAMEEALAIARTSQSKIAESRALVNLADIRLRRRQFKDAFDLSKRSLDLAVELDDAGTASTSKANMGFALFGLGRVAEGKRLCDEALAGYERTGATAEIAGLLGEYGEYLEKAGDYKAALTLYYRQRRLNDEIALAAHERTVLEIQEKYESEKRRREIELLNRDNDVKSAELNTRILQQRGWWVLAAVLGISFVVVAILYRKLRATNYLLGQRNRELSFQSSRDPLTALYNRRYFQDFIGGAGILGDRRRGDGKTIEALLLIDLDHFKEVNDRYGHAAGDAVLVAVALRLRETLRETDMIVRWGGEEFLVFVGATQPDKLDEIALRIMHAVAAEPFRHHGIPIALTASVGFVPTTLPPRETPLPWERVIHLADMALYLAKMNGRNRGYGIRALVDDENETLAAAEHDLERACQDGLVDMHVLPGYVAPRRPDSAGLAAATPIGNAGAAANPLPESAPQAIVMEAGAGYRPVRR